ncbi:Fungal specific transcription factor domain-containing protein [Rutstroemia sp. NJR-2017a BBW]|nr:Fungal specific transcription factor domain-containing protein [Rutstroemia sp. NJR-2017a BBW]
MNRQKTPGREGEPWLVPTVVLKRSNTQKLTFYLGGRTHPCQNCTDYGQKCIFPFVKRRVGSKCNKPRKDLEDRLARMESLLELSNSGRLSSSEQDLTNSLHNEQQAQLPSSAEATETGHLDDQSFFPLAMPNDAAELADRTDNIGIESPESDPNFRSQTTQETSQIFASTSSLTQSQIFAHHTSPQGIQGSLPHVECADLLGSEVGWEYHGINLAILCRFLPNLIVGPTSFLSICSIPGIAWVSEISEEPRFFEIAKALVLNIDLRLKMRRGPRHQSIAEPDEDAAWKWCQAYFNHSFDAGLGLVSKEHFELRLHHHFAQKDFVDDDPAWYALRNTNLPQAEQHQRVRLFWILYILEKHISYRSGRPSIIDDDDISCSLPSTQVSDSTTRIEPLIYIAQHARISSRIAKQLASGKSFRQTHAKTLEVIQELNTELQEWRDSLPPFLQPDAPTTRHGKRPQNINEYHVMYLRYAYYGSIIAIHSILTHPWNSSLFGSGQSSALQDRISISSHLVVNAARGIILDTDAIHITASTPIWLAFYFPLVSAINIFIYILKYPALPTASSDVALLDISAGHFGRLELASPETALPFVREIAKLARTTVERVKRSVKFPVSLLVIERRYTRVIF